MATMWHGCDQGILSVDESEIDGSEEPRMREGEKKPMTETKLDRFSIPEIFAYIYQKPIPEERSCICIPLHPAENDDWTELMMKSLGSKDKEGRGVRVVASDALENYMALGAQENCMSSEIMEAKGVEVTYGACSLILPRVNYNNVLKHGTDWLVQNGWFLFFSIGKKGNMGLPG